MDRLEGSQRSKREESVAKLLNLDRFTSMENDYSSKQDTASDELERAQQKKEIAEIEEEKIPEKVEEKKKVESKLQVIGWKQKIEKLEDDIDDAETRIEERIDEVHGLANEIREIQKLKVQLPDKEERKGKLDQLHSDFQNLEGLDDAISDMNELETLDKKIEQLDSKISDLEDERDQLSNQLDTTRNKLEKYEYLDLLDNWRRLKKAATREERIEKEEKEHKQEKKKAEGELEEVEKERSETAGRRKAVLGVGGGVSLVTLIIGALISPFAFLGVLLGLGIATYGYVNYDPSQYDSQIESLHDKISTHKKELTKLEGQREDMEETEAEDPNEELERTEINIKELDRTVPSSPNECSELQTKARKALEDSLDQDELESNEKELSDKISRKKEKISSKKDELAEKQDEREELDKERIQERINGLKRKIVGEERDRDEIEAELKERAEKLDVKPEKQKINSIKSGLQTEIEKDKEKIEKTAHGAGRRMSRRGAKGKFWGEDVKDDLWNEDNIYVRATHGSIIAEEAPGAYKDIDEVVKVSDEVGIGNPVARLRPMGVAKG